MSDITEQIRRYRSGEVSREELVRDLGSRKYLAPSHLRDIPADQYEQLVQIEAANRFEDGTFGEVDRAYHGGLLPEDVYMDIVRAIDKRADRPRPRRRPS